VKAERGAVGKQVQVMGWLENEPNTTMRGLVLRVVEVKLAGLLK